jgi:hypothetical protein
VRLLDIQTHRRRTAVLGRPAKPIILLVLFPELGPEKTRRKVCRTLAYAACDSAWRVRWPGLKQSEAARKSEEQVGHERSKDTRLPAHGPTATLQSPQAVKAATALIRRRFGHLEIGRMRLGSVTVALDPQRLKNFRVSDYPNHWPIEHRRGWQRLTPYRGRRIDGYQIPKNSASVATVRLRCGIA